MSYDSKYSGAVAEQMLDDYVAGNLGGEGGAKVYELDYYDLGETVTPEEYSAIKDADRVFISGALAIKRVDDGGTISLTATRGLVELVEPISASESYVSLYVVEVYEALIVKKYVFNTLLPTKTSQLTNDSHFLTSKSIELQLLIPTKTSQLTNDSGFITADESPKIYHMDGLAAGSGTISQEVYDAILAADVVVYGDYITNVFKEDSRCIISYIFTLGTTVINNRITITEDLNYTFTQSYYTIPTTTSELTNDSGFITAADLPPSGGLPTEVIELSSEITLQEGKMLEIDMYAPVTGTLKLNNPTITDTTQGLLFGIRFLCGDPAPQLTLGLLGFTSLWTNGELPQLEANTVFEIIGVKLTRVGWHLLSWAIYK